MASAACNRARLAVTASAFALVVAAGPALAQDAAPSQEATSVGDIIVTAQKREQSIQDVPIAVSAFSAETLDAMKIEGGSELLRAIPNVSFAKNNFSMYNFSIRGIGTKAVSASSDPAVAVSFNNSPMIRNRLFESEYMDVNRVEVLRGPQGTLYGRNATAGVVNMIPNMPGPDFEALLKAEAGNYGSVRGQMMVNLPLADTFWVRGAASMTKRDGFDYNTFTESHVNGRDLYSTRFSAMWEPNDRFNATLIWERFGEDDNRSRTGKNLCTRDEGPAKVGNVDIPTLADRGRMSQGCLPGSLYDDAAYGVPNGLGLSQMLILSGVGIGYQHSDLGGGPVYASPAGIDPYDGLAQSRNLREISTSYNPKFVADNDIFQLNLRFDLSDNLTLYSQTLYTEDSYWSTQDYNRYITNNVFNSTDNLYGIWGDALQSVALPGGFYNDPQLGLSSRMESADLSRSENSQFYQEFRLQSAGNEFFNYSLGANYTKFKTKDDYFVFNNVFSFLAEYFYNRVPNFESESLLTRGCIDGSNGECVGVDYSSLSDLNGDGHNYFRSKNESVTKSIGLFGEGYFQLSPVHKLTVGLRYTDDEKVFTPYPSQLLLGSDDTLGYGSVTGGNVVSGYPAMPDIVQNWQAVTGRVVLDWKLSDNSLLYASYSRGYKGGGANPPRADLNESVVQYQPLGETFEPEYVDALELGLKYQNSSGSLRLNTTAFYYDYSDYQISQIVDRISFNENFDASAYGLEFEAVWRPIDRLRVDANVGLLRTRIADGESSIDVMNRTQGNPDWVVLRPWIQVPSNCIAPKAHVETIFSSFLGVLFSPYALSALCGGSSRNGSYDPDFPSTFPFWQYLGITYNPFEDAPNGGRGFAADLSGNEFPNAPRVTANVGVQYEFSVGSWGVVPRIDYYRQSSSYFRVYNSEYDKIRAWDNMNISLTVESVDRDLFIQAYVKNVFDDTSIVDAFTNSDDSMLTTNVFTTEPRVYGLSVTKRF